jgi:hypothetical protein
VPALALALVSWTGQYKYMAGSDEDWNLRYEKAVAPERERQRRDNASMKRLIPVYCLGIGVPLGAIGLLIGPVGGWHDPSTGARFANSAIFLIAGAGIGLRFAVGSEH